MDIIKYSAYQKRLESDVFSGKFFFLGNTGAVFSGKSGQIRTREF